MTQLSDKDQKAQMEDMKSFDEQLPCVGIFWYDPEEHSFFGVHKEELTALLEQEFSLPYFEFLYDYHWDLGHGWSGDMPNRRTK